MRTGLLGGTFDPPHNGHLHLARTAQDLLALDRILFIPCLRQPLKTEAPSASPFHRAAMVALAIGGRADWILETTELERAGVSYTADTVESLAAKFPGDEFFLILGRDSFDTFAQWYHYEKILERVTLAVVPREGPDTGPASPPPAGARVVPLQCPRVTVSSTEIRERRAAGRPVDDLTPAEVSTYIYKQDLYRG